MSNEWSSGTDQCIFIWYVLRADGMKPPFASAVNVMPGKATEFVTDEAMAGVNILQYA